MYFRIQRSRFFSSILGSSSSYWWGKKKRVMIFTRVPLRKGDSRAKVAQSKRRKESVPTFFDFSRVLSFFENQDMFSC